MKSDKLNVFIICTGVGHINRGYESFTIECFNELKGSQNFELYLLKGGGKSIHKELKIPCVKRNSKLASFLSKITGKGNYWIEEFTFLIGMLPKLLKYRPAVIYYSDFVLGTFLWHLRKLLNLKYKLLFSNGAPNGPPFKTEDHIQMLLPVYVQEALAAGTEESKLTLLPYATVINKQENIDRYLDKNSIRKRLSIPIDKKIILSVGAINKSHKRMDYVVEEFSMMDQEKYFLIILGQIYEESQDIINLAEKKLNKNNYLFRQVGNQEVPFYMSSADYFILASTSEGLPRVLPEALSNGLIPIVHDYTVTRQTLNQYGVFKNLTDSGALQLALKEVAEKEIPREDIINFAWENYSWDNLGDKYQSMITKLLN